MDYEVRHGTMTIALSGTTTSATQIIAGQLGHLVVNVPALTGTGTVTIRGTSAIGGTIYPIGTQTESGIIAMGPVGTPTFYDGTLYVTVEETSGTQDAAANLLYDIYYATRNG